MQQVTDKFKMSETYFVLKMDSLENVS